MNTAHIMQNFVFLFRMISSCHDKTSRFVYIMTRGTREFLIPEDFIPLVQDVVDTHPGLTFLKEATEFHSRYVHTVSTACFRDVCIDLKYLCLCCLYAVVNRLTHSMMSLSITCIAVS
jgi:hypothetical protein